VQFSAIEGRTIITFAMSHSVANGVGNIELVRVLSEKIRAASERPGSGSDVSLTPSIGLDRSPILNLRGEKPSNIEDHPAYGLKEPASTPAQSVEKPIPHPFEAFSSDIPVLFRISTVKLAQLKLDATEDEATPISTHDALGALVWRSVLLIRSRRSAAAQSISASTISNLFMPLDGRRTSAFHNLISEMLSISSRPHLKLEPSSGHLDFRKLQEQCDVPLKP
jgi:hypothetical protein